MHINKIYYTKIFLLVLIILSYFLGFLFRENSAGGAESDFIYHTWPAIQGIKENFLLAIKNYGEFKEGSWPMFHILNVFFNPFTNSQLSFQFSITIISIFNFFILGSIIRNKFKIERIDAFLFSSIILLLPCFRSSAFWGLAENFGWLFLLLAIKFYLKIEHLAAEKKINKEIFVNIFFMCFFSSLALYTRQYLVFFPIFIFLQVLFVKKNIQLFLILAILFGFFSLPGFALIYTWGGLYSSSLDSNFMENFHHPKYILKNLPFFFNFFAFYLFPFLLIETKSFGFNKIIKKYYKSFAISFFTLILLYFFNFFDYLQNIEYGGGVFLKLDYFFFKKNLIFFIIMTSIGFSLLYEIIKQNLKSNLMLLLTLLILCLPKFIYHEYYEPLILYVFLLLFSHNIAYLFEKKFNFSILLIIFYYGGYLLGSIYFKHFLFADPESWRIFIQS